MLRRGETVSLPWLDSTDNVELLQLNEARPSSRLPGNCNHRRSFGRQANDDDDSDDDDEPETAPDRPAMAPEVWWSWWLTLADDRASTVNIGLPLDPMYHRISSTSRSLAKLMLHGRPTDSPATAITWWAIGALVNGTVKWSKLKINDWLTILTD